MNKQSKPTKRQMRNLKVVRWPNGQLFVANTKVGVYHCYGMPEDRAEESRMIHDVAVREVGVHTNKAEISSMWNGRSDITRNVTQIRL